ncbi:hypothetical protein R5R73_04755 [Salinicola sp. LHM]|uniref:hypothetical protein n=1 Tax=Salinicola sp. LHM TaxID=3065298 RepID=UPI002ACE659D|nr:hypothetical protein [Salinicola sp. LHM]WQH33999.1 hypothetical protein R5R73_04755 [Salinicola sp. LHM]
MIHLLSGSTMGAELPTPTRKGINPLFRARITVDGESRQCFIKPQPDKLAVDTSSPINREVINEVVGYLLARACGFRVPDHAGVILLERHQIPAAVLNHVDSISPTPQHDAFVCWFSEDTGHKDLVALHSASVANGELEERLHARIAQDLVSRKELPALISFDEWTLNSDRNAGNVLGSASTYITPIDHGRIFCSPIWKHNELKAMCRWVIENQMIHWANRGKPGWSQDKRNMSARLVAYQKFVEAFTQTGHSTVRDTLTDLSVDGDEIESILDCLYARLDEDHARFAIGLVA